MSSALRVSGLAATDIEQKINLLICNLINIKDETGQFLMPLPDGRVIDTKSWNGWDWTHGIGLYGLYQYHSLRPGAQAMDVIRQWFNGRLAEGTTKNINTMAAMLTLAFVYEESGERSYLPWLDRWAEWAMHDLPRTKQGGFQHVTYDYVNEGELWDDTLMMTVLPLAKIGMLLKRPEYVEEAKRQFMVHVNYLQDKATGLWFHGWKFDEDAEGGGGDVGHNFARVRWARGNAWITIAIPEFIEIAELSEGDALRMYLVDVLRAQCEALKRHQLSNGMWKTVLDVEDERNYEEASATAGFAYGLLKAVRKRYIGQEYADIAMRAIKAVIGRISKDGELRDVSFGTGVGRDLQHYFDIKRTAMPYGQAMAMMALVEFLRVFI